MSGVLDLREREHRAAAQEALMGAYRELTAAGVTTRAAALSTGMPRSSAPRRPRRADPAGSGMTRSAPANRLSEAERAEGLAGLGSPRFVGQPPIQGDATPLG